VYDTGAQDVGELYIIIMPPVLLTIDKRCGWVEIGQRVNLGLEIVAVSENTHRFCIPIDD
jgi:hypothetical protein